MSKAAGLEVRQPKRGAHAGTQALKGLAFSPKKRRAKKWGAKAALMPPARAGALF